MVSAVNYVKTHEEYRDDRCKAFVCDITSDQLHLSVPRKSIDICSAMFVLSAIPPEKLDAAVLNIKQILKLGGIVILRDYGQYDCAQLRFKKGHKMADDFYVRQDGTFSYYFTTELMEAAFKKHGFDTIENQYIKKIVVNRKENITMNRVFIQSKFMLVDM